MSEQSPRASDSPKAVPDASAPWFTFEINRKAGAGSVSFSTVPGNNVSEPGGALLAVSALAALGLRRRKG